MEIKFTRVLKDKPFETAARLSPNYSVNKLSYAKMHIAQPKIDEEPRYEKVSCQATVSA